MNKKDIKKGRHPRMFLSGISLIGYINKEKSLFVNNKKAGDSRQRLSGMTTLFNNGFTLIELLVVVLIIGILAAIALPQYQKAVEKAYFAEAVVQVKALGNAEKIYFLANGEYTRNWEDLDVGFEGTPQDEVAYRLDQKNWFLSLENAISKNYVHASRQKEYQDGRWYILYYLPTDTMYCRALAADSKAQKVCKMFGVQGACPWNADDNTCYNLP